MAKIDGVQEVAVDALIPYANNAKKHGGVQVDLIAKSITEFGFLNPILIDSNNNIIAGHGRLMAAKKLGLQKVPCIYVEGLTEEQYKAYVLADNKLTELGEWDMELVKSELESLEAAGFDLDLTGFDLAEFDTELEDISGVEEVDDFYTEKEPTAKYGNVYKLGEHYLMCGDSTVRADVITLMDGKKADLLLTDPLYNVNYEGTAGTIQNDNMEDTAFLKFLTDAFMNADYAMRGGASFYIWHADSEGYNFRRACKDAGWNVRQNLVWVKDSLVLGRQDYQRKHEPCLYGWKDGASHYWAGGRKERTTITAFDIFELRNKDASELLKFMEEQWCDREDNETSVLYEERPKASDEHPTMKPLKLVSRQIRNSSQPGDTVLDLFGGSGSTLMACEQLGRKCRTMEYDPKYVDVIIARWEKYTGKKAVLLND